MPTPLLRWSNLPNAGGIEHLCRPNGDYSSGGFNKQVGHSRQQLREAQAGLLDTTYSWVYFSDWEPGLAWVKVTSTLPETITLPSGDTLRGYASIVVAWDNITGETVPQATDVWFTGINGEVPALNVIYQCRLVGVDTDGVVIWAERFNAVASVKDLLAVSQTIILVGRTVTDAVLDSTNTVTSATGNFTSADVGSTVIGNGIAQAHPPMTLLLW